VDILADVLAAAEKGARKTRIMQQANLSHDLLRKYLGEAVSNAFLQSNGFGFELTEKGQEFLEQYKQLYKEYSKVGSSLKSIMSKWEALEHTCRNFPNNGRKTDAGEDKRNLRLKTSRSDRSKEPL